MRIPAPNYAPGAIKQQRYTYCKHSGTSKQPRYLADVATRLYWDHATKKCQKGLQSSQNFRGQVSWLLYNELMSSKLLWCITKYNVIRLHTFTETYTLATTGWLKRKHSLHTYVPGPSSTDRGFPVRRTGSPIVTPAILSQVLISTLAKITGYILYLTHTL